MGLPAGSWEGWNLDLAVAVFGNREERKAKKPGRGQRGSNELKQLLEDKSIPDEEKFASVRQKPMKKMKVPESGVW